MGGSIIRIGLNLGKRIGQWRQFVEVTLDLMGSLAHGEIIVTIAPSGVNTMESSTAALTTVTPAQLMLAQKMERSSAHAITRFCFEFLQLFRIGILFKLI